MKLNVNHTVRITLTRSGANLINTGRINAKLPEGTAWAAPGTVIEEQLWVVMEAFGPHMRMGSTLFRTEIETVEEPGPGIDAVNEALDLDRARIRTHLLGMADEWVNKAPPWTVHDCAFVLRQFAVRAVDA